MEQKGGESGESGEGGKAERAGRGCGRLGRPDIFSNIAWHGIHTNIMKIIYCFQAFRVHSESLYFDTSNGQYLKDCYNSIRMEKFFFWL